MSSRDDRGAFQKVTDFLFGEHVPKNLSNLDIRTIIPTREMFELIHYHQDMDILGSDVGKKLKESYEALLISVNGKSREQGVEVGKGQQEQKYKEIRTGISQELLKNIKTGEGEIDT